MQTRVRVTSTASQCTLFAVFHVSVLYFPRLCEFVFRESVFYEYFGRLNAGLETSKDDGPLALQPRMYSKEKLRRLKFTRPLPAALQFFYEKGRA
jgi:hypothetical protein